MSNINISTAPKIEKFTFTGSGGEYFKVWIVNILLTIITLGIYSAWAKVRNKQYFYGNTFLAGSSFEYTANPVQILKSRAIAVVFYIIYELAASFNPILYYVLVFVIIVATPWIIMKALNFNARYSQYRNVRFSFEQNIKEAMVVYLLIPFVLILPVISIGLYMYFSFMSFPTELTTDPAASVDAISGNYDTYLQILKYFIPISLLVSFLTYPYIVYRSKHYIAKNHYFGQTRFSSKLMTSKPFYNIYLKAFAIFFIAFAVIGLILFFLGNVSTVSILTQSFGLPAWANILTTLIFVFIYALIFAFIKSQTYNLIYQTTKIGDNKLRAKMQTKSLAILYVTNTLGIILTLGLFIPWAKVRTARYRAEHTALQVNRNLEEFIANKREEQNALGEEFGDVFDIDVAI